VVARVQQTELGTPLVDIEKIRETLAANGVGIISGAGAANVSMTYNDYHGDDGTKLPIDGSTRNGAGSEGNHVNKTIASVREEVVSNTLPAFRSCSRSIFPSLFKFARVFVEVAAIATVMAFARFARVSRSQR